MTNDSLSSIVLRASRGDSEALMAILRKYKGVIDRESRINGSINEDLRQYIIIRLLLAIPRFTQ